MKSRCRTAYQVPQQGAGGHMKLLVIPGGGNAFFAFLSCLSNRYTV